MKRAFIAAAATGLILIVLAVVGLVAYKYIPRTIAPSGLYCTDVENHDGYAILTIDYPMQSYGGWDSYIWHWRSGKLYLNMKRAGAGKHGWPAKVRVPLDRAKITDVYIADSGFNPSTARHAWPK